MGRNDKKKRTVSKEEQLKYFQSMLQEHEEIEKREREAQSSLPIPQKENIEENVQSSKIIEVTEKIIVKEIKSKESPPPPKKLKNFINEEGLINLTPLEEEEKIPRIAEKDLTSLPEEKMIPTEAEKDLTSLPKEVEKVITIVEAEKDLTSVQKEEEKITSVAEAEDLTSVPKEEEKITSVGEAKKDLISLKEVEINTENKRKSDKSLVVEIEEEIDTTVPREKKNKKEISKGEVSEISGAKISLTRKFEKEGRQPALSNIGGEVKNLKSLFSFMEKENIRKMEEEERKRIEDEEKRRKEEEERRKEEERREVEDRARRLIEKENKALRKRKRNRHWFTNSKNSPKNFVKKINKV